MNAAIRFALFALVAALPSASAAAERPYTSARLIFPSAGEAVRANGGELSVEVQITPVLHSGHRAQLLLDGVPQGPSRPSPRFHLVGVDRGEHRLQVRVVDADGEILFNGKQSIFYLLRHSRLHRRNRTP